MAPSPQNPPNPGTPSGPGTCVPPTITAFFAAGAVEDKVPLIIVGPAEVAPHKHPNSQWHVN